MKKLLSVFLAVVMCVTAIFTVTSVSAYDTKATDSDSNVIVKFSGSTLLIEGLSLIHISEPTRPY